MARIEVFPDRVVVKLRAAERTLAIRRRDIVLSRERITSALITDDPWVWLRGVRFPGTHLPMKLAIGTWRGFGGNDFCLIRSGRPAVVLDFEMLDNVNDEAVRGSEADDRDGEFDDFARVILSTEHAAEIIEALRVDGAEAATSFETGK